MAARPPKWLILTGVAVLAGGAAILGPRLFGPQRAVAPAPAVRRTPRAITSPSAFDPTIEIDAPTTSRPGGGTAFSVSPGGVWLTARHVVEGCARTAIVVGPGQGVAAEVRIDPRGETAVLITQGGAPALPLAPRTALRRGMTAFHPGFPHGRPGEVASRLLRRETLVMRGRRSRRESVLAWTEADSIGVSGRSLAGLSGAPALDSAGQVIGVTIAQAPRRGRVYTTSPAALHAALARVHVETATGAKAAPMNEETYGRASNVLRRDLRVVPVVCLPA